MNRSDVNVWLAGHSLAPISRFLLLIRYGLPKNVLKVLAALPMVVVASGGINKAPTIAAVGRKKLVSVLVSDEATAAEALRLYRAASTTSRPMARKSSADV